MKTTVYKVRRSFLSEEEFLTPRNAFERSLRSCSAPIEVEIPEYLEPKEDIEGRVMVTYDGSRYLLEEVLGINRFGQPALIFEDQQFSAPRSITLPVVV